MRVLLLGGTGAIGQYLSYQLCKHNILCTCTSRVKRKSTSEYLQYIEGNAHSNDFLLSICKEKWDVIVDFMHYETEEFKNRVSIFTSATNQYVYISSSRVYGNTESPIKETSPRLLDCVEDYKYKKSEEYALAKARQEDILNSCKKKNYTIVRPYITYGYNRLQLGVLEKEEWIYRALQGRTIIFSKDIAQKYTTLTHGYDVATCIFNILGKESALGKTFHFTSNNSLTWMEVFTIYSNIIEDICGIRPKIKLVSTKLFLKTVSESRYYQVFYDRLFDRKFDTSLQDEFVNQASFIKLEHGMRDCVERFLKAPTYKYLNWELEAKKDKISKERTLLNEIRNLKSIIQYLMHRYII